MFGAIHTDLEAFHLQHDHTVRSEVKSVQPSLVHEQAQELSWGSYEALAVPLLLVSSNCM